ncbi:MAG: type II secretion system protein GspG, partial [Candidatus Omnitrophica bacterium]|nr:type II secretion system protein GspG [Candidatus Omnitrophota bacterium]
MELLVVMAIIVILAGMAVGGAQMARKRGAVTKAQATIAALEAAIDMYDMDIGEYPDAGNENLVQALSDTSNPDPDWDGPYMKLREQDLVDGEFVDPWGNPYVYINPGTHNLSSYDIYSYGLNGQDEQGAGDDVNNW